MGEVPATNVSCITRSVREKHYSAKVITFLLSGVLQEVLSLTTSLSIIVWLTRRQGRELD